MASLERRQWLKGQFKEASPTFRPPWALDEASFVEFCTRCNDCIDRCPEQVITKGDGGFPIMNFAQHECTFCGLCDDACTTGALNRATSDRPWQIVATITDQCLNRRDVLCQSCGDPCPTGAIRFRPKRGGTLDPLIEEDACTGCGACISACPTQGVRMIHQPRGDA